ncbi:bacteriohemerythrin [Alkalimarinus coralli]|uniref:bacteriohemerythrin n=1 Tax=Alkalimarinus coralli TaxID=2935863 RepID=UPI00202B7CAF|nr:bacteriohemerythrin [Alkalimarinus coralli]
MTIFEWKSEYDTGVEEIDNQHKVLVSLINELDSLVGERFDRGAAEEVFNKLKSYTVFHFATEESLMAEYHYVERDLHAHLLQHRQFEEEIGSVQHDFSQVSREDCNVILSYLTNWLIKHICKVDQRLAAFILAKKQAASQYPLPDDDVNLPDDSLSLSDSSLPKRNFWGLSADDEEQIHSQLTVVREHIEGTDKMLCELEVCIGELRGHCDSLVKSVPNESQSQVSDEAYTHCVQGIYLVKSLQNKQTKLRELLNDIELGDFEA